MRSHNLFVLSLAGGKERALTTGGTEEIRKGEPDWVYPEELDLKTAYWWSPDSSKIAFLEMDESKVSKYPLLDFASYDGDAEEERYPVAGGSNPVVHVYTVNVGGGEAETDGYRRGNESIPTACRLVAGFQTDRDSEIESPANSTGSPVCRCRDGKVRSGAEGKRSVLDQHRR